MSASENQAPKARKHRRGEDGQTAADRVFKSAAELFYQKGYATTTTRELAESLGINKATLYHYISGKEDLLVAICRESLARITARVAEVADSEPPSTRLREMVREHLACALGDREMHMVMLTELRALSPQNAQEIIELRAAYERLLREAVIVDQQEGRLRTDLEARQLTLALLNLLNWTIFWFNPGREESIPEVSAWLSAVFFEGAGANSSLLLPA